MKITLPTNKIWRVSYLGELWGHIINAFNLDLFSSQGKIKLSNVFTPHTTSDDIDGLKSPTDFTIANIDDGKAETKKIWAIADDKKIIRSEGVAKFTAEGTTGLESGEDTSDSDIISIKDDTGEEMETTPVYITGTPIGEVYITGNGSNTKWAQTFKASGELKKISLEIRKNGSPSDNFVIKVQEDNAGVPSGVTLATDTVAGADLTSSYANIEFDDLSDASLDVTKTYWLIFERSGVASGVNYYVIKYLGSDSEDTDPYAGGELKSWTGSAWKEWKIGEETDNDLATADNAVAGATAGWSGANLVYDVSVWESDTLYASAKPGSGETYSHVWKTFGFSVPTTAIIKKIEVEIRTFKNVDKSGLITLSLTKNAKDVAGTSVFISPTLVTPNTRTEGLLLPLWGTTWTPAEVNSANFGVRLDALGHPDGDLTYGCVYLKVKVYYQDEDTAGDNYLDSMISVQINFPEASERVFVTTTKDVKFLSEEGGTWQSLWKGILGQSELNEDYPSILRKWGLTEVLFLGNENKIHSIAKRALGLEDAEIGRIEVSSQYYVKWIVTTKSLIFAGFEDKNSAYLPSIVVCYDPLSETTRSVTIGEGTTVGFGDNENGYIIDIRGQIRRWNGVNFQVIDHLPPYFLNEKVAQLPHRNAFVNKDGNIHFLWKGQYPYPAGIWTIEKETPRVYHKSSLGALEVSDAKALFYTGEKMYAGVKSGDEGVFAEGSSIANGYFVTPRITTDNIDERWQNILLKYDPVKPAVNTGNFNVKCRTERGKIAEGVDATAFNGTWTTTTAFTCDDATFKTAVDAGYIEVGNEVIVRTGQGATRLAHITIIAGDESAIKTITIDEAIGSAGKTMTFSIENWEKINFQDFSNTKFSQLASLKDRKGEWIQFKVAQSGSYELEEIQSLSNIESQIQPR